MFFGAQSFSSAPFASEFIGNVTVLVNGKQINVAIGNVVVDTTVRVNITGQRFNLALGDPFVITWNSINPGATGVWIPIDPDNP